MKQKKNLNNLTFKEQQKKANYNKFYSKVYYYAAIANLHYEMETITKEMEMLLEVQLDYAENEVEWYIRDFTLDYLINVDKDNNESFELEKMFYDDLRKRCLNIQFDNGYIDDDIKNEIKHFLSSIHDFFYPLPDEDYEFNDFDPRL